jgi:hypothetical protein
MSAIEILAVYDGLAGYDGSDRRRGMRPRR